MADLTALGYAQRTWALTTAELDNDDDAINLLLADLDPVQLGHLLHAFVGQLAGQMIERYGSDARTQAHHRALNVADLDERERAGE